MERFYWTAQDVGGVSRIMESRIGAILEQVILHDPRRSAAVSLSVPVKDVLGIDGNRTAAAAARGAVQRRPPVDRPGLFPAPAPFQRPLPRPDARTHDGTAQRPPPGIQQLPLLRQQTNPTDQSSEIANRVVARTHLVWVRLERLELIKKKTNDLRRGTGGESDLQHADGLGGRTAGLLRLLAPANPRQPAGIAAPAVRGPVPHPGTRPVPLHHQGEVLIVFFWSIEALWSYFFLYETSSR